MRKLHSRHIVVAMPVSRPTAMARLLRTNWAGKSTSLPKFVNHGTLRSEIDAEQELSGTDGQRIGERHELRVGGVAIVALVEDIVERKCQLKVRAQFQYGLGIHQKMVGILLMRYLIMIILPR